MVILKLTSAGLNAALNSQENGIVLKIDKIKFGSGKYAVVDNDPRTAMVNPFVSTQFVGGDVEPNSHTLRFNCSFKDTQSRDVYEIGLFTEENVLFAVASTTGEPFFTTSKTLVTVFIGGMKLGAFNSESVQIVLDENGAIALQLMGAHESHPNPHPQYTFKSEFDALKEQNELEHNNLLTLITATSQNANVSIEEAVSFLSSLINQHQNANNPHPQYLLASTFGVELQMTASENTPILDKNRVFGWNGVDGDTLAFDKSPRWWTYHDETVTFKPFRAYGQFLLGIQFKPEGDGKLSIATFSKDDVKLAEHVILDLSTTSFDQFVKHVFYLNKGEYAKIRINGRVWNENWGFFKGSIYVDDRVKIFSPVGYQSSVELANTVIDGSESTENPIDYSEFSSAEWSWYDSDNQIYVALESTTFITPEDHLPHYHRGLFAASQDLWIRIEAGTQSVQTPSDYVSVSSKVIRGSTDGQGNIVITIPLSLRSIAIPEGSKGVYTVTYFDHEYIEGDTNSLDGNHVFYVQLNNS